MSCVPRRLSSVTGDEKDIDMSDRLYSDPDFYVRVQKTKLLLAIVLLALAAALGRFDTFFA